VARHRVTAAAAGAAGPAVAELLAYRDECERARDREGVAAARSWLEMLAPEYDPEVAELFAGFTRDERMMREMRRGAS
jgi:hypothetical protein